jgi:hypothetical protein
MTLETIENIANENFKVTKKWKARDPKKRKIVLKKYYDNNIEKFRQYYNNNKEKISEKKRQYYIKKKEEIKAKITKNDGLY